MEKTSAAPPFPPLLAIFLGIIGMSTASILIRFAQTEASSLVIAAYRLTIASLFLAPIAFSRHLPEIRSLSRRDMLLGAISGILLAFHFASWISSLEYTSVASSAVLVATSPLWVALLSPFTIKEPITRRVALGLAVALAGTLIISLADLCQTPAGFHCPSLSSFFQGQAFIGDILALIGAWMAAGYILIGRTLRAKLSLIAYIFIVYGIAAITLIILALASNQQFFGFSPKTYLFLILLAVIPQLFGHSTVNWALKYLSAAYVSITLLGEPISSTILAAIILSEIPSLFKIFGAILILGGIIITSLKQPSSPS